MANRLKRLSDYEVKALNALGMVSSVLGIGDYLRGVEQNNIVQGQPRRVKYLAPPAASTTRLINAHAMTVAAQDVTSFANAMTEPRVVSITGGFASMAGNVVVTGTNAQGKVISDTIALNGTATVAGVRAFASITNINIPAYTNDANDTISVGITTAFGLDYAMEGAGVIKILVDLANDTIASQSGDPLSVSKSLVTPTTVANATRNYIFYYFPVVASK